MHAFSAKIGVKEVSFHCTICRSDADGEVTYACAKNPRVWDAKVHLQISVFGKWFGILRAGFIRFISYFSRWLGAHE